MRQIADFHIHSPYSRAVSKEMTLENLDIWARKKGITIMGTGDFTHPVWFGEIQKKLEEREPGLFALKTNKSPEATRFILTGEISSIYTKNNKGRRVHNLIFAPNIEAVKKINTQLGWIGNIKSDGRPILGLDPKELLKIVLEIDPKCFLVPCHAWTPWFSVFGSMSGFNSVEECFEEMSDKIFALETGLSSDPAMNWRLSQLDKYTLISCSDAHSLGNLGREACVFEIEPGKLSFDEIKRIIKEKDKKKFLYTVEFFPEEGKYHYDGHRLCQIRLSPKETKKYNGLCPVCGKPMTIGVMSRVEELADREENFAPANTIPFKSLVPLAEIIAEALGQGKATKLAVEEYEKLISGGGNEFRILLDLSEAELSEITLPRIVEGIIKVRKKELFVLPGYDGEYGIVKIFSQGEKTEPPLAQKSLFG
ncbi:MAG: endonuclease Q family protein [Candidatus Paceibacterota bacterium]